MWKNKPFVIFFGVVVTVSVVFLVLAWRTVRFYDLLLQNGVKTPGKIVRHYTRTGNRGYGENHYFVYRFSDSRGRSHEDQIIRNKPKNHLKVGQAIEILYDPLNPSRNMPSLLLPADIHQPIYTCLKFMVATLGLTLAFGAVVFSRMAQIRLRWSSFKRLLGPWDR